MSVFREEGMYKLGASYVPSDIPFRRSHEEEIVRTFLPLSQGTMQIPWSLIVNGPSGTGKTVTVRRAMDRILEAATARNTKLLARYLNCRFATTDFALAQMIAMSVIPRAATRGFGASELIAATEGFLSSEGTHLLLVLDDFDAFLRTSKYVSRTLNEILKSHEERRGRIYIILASIEDIAQSFDEKWVSNYVWRTREKYAPYTYREIQGILSPRAEESLRPNATNDEVILMIARMTEKFGYGSARYALEIMLASGLEADWRHSKKIVPEHVRIAQGRIESALPLETIGAMGEATRVGLRRIVDSLANTNAGYIDLTKTLPDADKRTMDDLRRLSHEGLLDLFEGEGLQVGLIGCPLETLRRLLGPPAPKFRPRPER